MRQADIMGSAGFAFDLIRMFHASEDARDACPEEWREAAALLHTLIENDGMTTSDAARVLVLPETTVARYRAGVGI